MPERGLIVMAAVVVEAQEPAVLAFGADGAIQRNAAGDLEFLTNHTQRISISTSGGLVCSASALELCSEVAALRAELEDLRSLVSTLISPPVSPPPSPLAPPPPLSCSLLHTDRICDGSTGQSGNCLSTNGALGVSSATWQGAAEEIWGVVIGCRADPASSTMCATNAATSCTNIDKISFKLDAQSMTAELVVDTCDQSDGGTLGAAVSGWQMWTCSGG